MPYTSRVTSQRAFGPPGWTRERLGRLMGAAFLVVSGSLVPDAVRGQQPRAPHARTAIATVRFRVRSEEGPVAGAAVRADSFSTLSDSLGSALLRLPAGRYPLRISRLGYATWKDTVSLQAAQDTLLVVQLEESAIQGEGITVSVTRTGKMVKDEPLPVEALPREEIEENLTESPADLTRLLTEMSGVRIQASEPTLGGAALRIEGLRGRYTRILSDGLPIYGAEPGALDLLQIPPLDLARIEVVRGAASALYGPAALGGVLDLVSRRPGGPSELLVSQSSAGATDASLFTSGRLGSGWSFTLAASGDRQARTDPDADGWTDLVGYDRAVLRPRFFWGDAKGDSLFVTVGGTVEHRTGGTLPGDTVPAGGPFAVRLNTGRVDGGVIGRLALGPALSLGARAAATSTWHGRTFGPDVEDTRRGSFYGEATLTDTAGRHDWVVGAALESTRFRYRQDSALDLTYVTPGLFAQDEWSPSRLLSVAASARLDHHSRVGTFLSPRLSVLLRPAEDWTVRASGGLGFSPPVPFLDRVQQAGYAALRPLSDSLRAERVRSASLDIGRAAGPLELHAIVFGSTISDALLVRTCPGASRPLEITNAAAPTRTWGTELLAHYRSGPLEIIASHTYLHATESLPEGAGRRAVPLDPRNRVGIDGIWEDEDWGRVGAEVTYIGPQRLEDDPYRTWSPGYVLVNFLAEVRMGRQRLFLVARNLGDVRQTGWDPLLLPVRSPDGRWTTDQWAPLEGRVVSAGVRVEF